jgi:C4-dicarboxylate transporter DctM subunit
MLAAAKLFAWILVINLVPQTIGEVIKPLVSTPESFLLLVMAVFILFGFVLEGVATMIMLVPVVAPLAPHFGVDLHHLALVIIMSVQIGLLTPPVALGLFIVCPFAGCTMKEAATEVVPFVFVILLIILTVIFVPGVAMWLPGAAGY